MHQGVRAIIRDEQISVRFQPIVGVRDRNLLAFEALARGPSVHPLHEPIALFAAAADAGVLPELDRACMRAAFRSASDAGYGGRLFLNVVPHSLLGEFDWAAELERLCRLHSIDPGACVLELTEQTLQEDFNGIRKTLNAIRSLGCEFAIDDFGTGQSGLRMWSELRPEFVKIDRYFANDVDRDPIKLEFVRSIIDMGRAVGSRIIVEGIETMAECSALFDLDVDGLQGYLFGRPKPHFVPAAGALIPLEALGSPEPPAKAGDLATAVAPVPPGMRISEFVRLLQERSQCAAFPVVDETGTAIGMIWRDRFLLTYSKPLHPEVLARKPVTAIMDTSPLILDAQLRLEQASRLVTRQASANGAEQFIVVRDGRYAGVARTVDLLTHITESRIKAAAHSNPLTGLPGNQPIHDNMARVIQQARPFVVCYVDLDDFKPYNDYYGYAKGDQVLLQLAQILMAAVSRRTDFVGHIGGDDFVMIIRSADWAERLVRVVDEFTARARGFYLAEDVARGGIVSSDRYGQTRRFPLLTLSVAIVDSRSGGWREPTELAGDLHAAKRRAKMIEGNCLWYDGRDLLGDPELLARGAVALPPDSPDADIDSGSYPRIGSSVA